MIFFQSSQFLQSVVANTQFHVKCNMIARCFFMTMNPKYLFFERSKLLNESHFSLHENVFSLIKRVKHLSEFSDFLLLKVLAIKHNSLQQPIFIMYFLKSPTFLVYVECHSYPER